MQVSYKRSLNHNYLILSKAGAVDTESYPVRLLITATPESFLTCTMQTVDNQLQFCYDVTSQHPLVELYEHKKMNQEDIRLLFGAIINTLETMEEYLLNSNCLYLKPEYIFVDPSKKEMKFCFLPMRDQDIVEQFREIAEYVLPKIDHMDQEAVMLGYNIYRKVMEDTLYVEQIKGELYRSHSELTQSDKPPRVSEPSPVAETAQFDQPLETFAELENENTQYPIIPTMGIVIASVAFFSYQYFFRYSRYSWKVYGVVAVALIILCVFPFGLRKIQEKRKKQMQITEKTANEDLLNVADGYLKEDPEPINQVEDEQTVMLAPSPLESLPRLIGVHPSILQPIVINSKIFILGKLESAADVVLPSAAVSRIHAKIVKEEGYCLYDLHSRNGTRVNQQLLGENEQHILRDGDEITFGDLTYRFCLNE